MANTTTTPTPKRSRKATHLGHCQICGALQMLPAGKLAKHGYTTRWGFFSGTCIGADALPFEQSINLIEAAIANAEREARELAAEAVTLRATSTGARTWTTVYDSATWQDRTSRTRWVEVDVLSESKVYSEGTPDEWTHTRFYAVTDARDMSGAMKPKSIELTANNYRATLADVVLAGNTARANERDRQAAQYREYAKWQRERIVGWAPAELIARDAK